MNNVFHIGRQFIRLLKGLSGLGDSANEKLMYSSWENETSSVKANTQKIVILKTSLINTFLE